MTQLDWQDRELRSLGIWYGKRSSTAGRLLLLLNAGDADLQFVLAEAPAGGPWIRRFDTARETLEPQRFDSGSCYPLVASSAALLEC